MKIIEIRKTRNFMILAGLLIIAVMMGCGKKGDPTLKSYEKPLAPTHLSAVHREDAIFLSWNYPASKENLIAQFVLLRSTGSGFEKLTHIAADKRNYSDRDIKTGTAYEYKVISQNPRGIYSDDSNTLEAKPVSPPPSPAKLSYKVSGDSVMISWQPTGKFDKYNIYRSMKKGAYGMKPMNTEPLSEPSFRDAFSVNNVYYYTVRSSAGSSIRDEGPASEELVVDAADLVPPMPLKLEAFATPEKVVLSWTEMDELWITGFNVYRKTGNSDFVLIGKTQIPTFLDPEPAVSKRDYKVVAVGKVKEGPAAEVKNVIYIQQR